MLKELLHQLFVKLENEIGNNKKSKNGNAIYFVEEILENQFKKPSFISSKAIKGYYDKYVEGKENNAGEPSIELKDLISKYLGYEHFLAFETQNKATNFFNVKKSKITLLNYSLTALLSLTLIVAFYKIYLANKNDDCVIWQFNHYEKVNCDNQFAIQKPTDINIEKFNKVNVNDSTIFFINNKPIIWYGKSVKGEIEFFNARGTHPITGKELKPVTSYIINKYVYKQ
ncbi:hypothetical protein EC396_04350 [Lutibacter sp. HS1-25]|uniref:hypothetical protein n=1 Tax=Lutibacter sp. HS1-25 TaxID=2485000 RepID=UPI001012071E|nr:hypothetical protein [Lutibacter sp. HS1-25]RXP60891.1 hypothetical protein EC396_04350 [Lutibacter sp. HS1-25]